MGDGRFRAFAPDTRIHTSVRALPNGRDRADCSHCDQYGRGQALKHARRRCKFRSPRLFTSYP